MIRKALRAAGWWLAGGALLRLENDKSFDAFYSRLDALEARLSEIAANTKSSAQETIPAGAYVARVEGVPPFYIFTHPFEQDEYISREIIANGTWEPFETEIVRRLLRHFDFFIDIGANIGWYSVIAQRVMQSGSMIYAFEPDPRNFSFLTKNVEQDNKIQTITVMAALSDQVGTAHLFHSATNMGDHQLYSGAEVRDFQEVQVTTLAEYFGSTGHKPALVKMDTQGSEPRIFRAGGTVLSPEARQSAYIVEFWPYGITSSGETVGAFIDTLSSYPHQPFVIDHNQKKLMPITWDALKERGETDLAPSTKHFVDLVLITPGTPAFLVLADLIAR